MYEIIILLVIISALFFACKKADLQGGSDIQNNNTDIPIQTLKSGNTKSLTVAQRNNNPGCLKFMNQRGATGQDSAGHAIFETVELGWSALYNQINLDKGRSHTLRSFLYKYAPPEDNNDTEAYIEHVRKLLYVGKPDIPLIDLDTKQLAQAIARHEGFYNA